MPKKKNKLISANEINRFVYCPYQWYYKRKYTAKELNEKYKALNKGKSSAESLFEKGLKHHKKHYVRYRIKSFLTKALGSILIGACIWYLFKSL